VAKEVTLNYVAAYNQWKSVKFGGVVAR